jgi:light-regulated signal transduction histidine kinase (bacteriophytochrome)
MEDLVACLSRQPTWSDLPFIILTTGGRVTESNLRHASTLEALGNVTLLERPVRPQTILSATRSALRARARQYDILGRQESLRRANADLEQFAYSASHDLKEPLRNISIYSELLELRYGPVLNGEGHAHLEVIRSGAKRMELLLQDLLSYIQVAGASDGGPVELTNANIVFGKVLSNLDAAIRETEAVVTSDSLPCVRISDVHLQQLLQNLIGNALKYRSERKPRVHLSAQAGETHWLLSVKDNGIGIAKQYAERIFGIFKRLHGTERYAGNGIGLAICQRIVERYGGRIWVESEPGIGSTFFLTLKV